jgi:hypothetical protein
MRFDTWNIRSLCRVVAKLRERISVSKRATQKFDLEKVQLKKLDDVEVKEK